MGKANSENVVSALTFPLLKFLPNVLFPVILPAVAFRMIPTLCFIYVLLLFFSPRIPLHYKGPWEGLPRGDRMLPWARSNYRKLTGEQHNSCCWGNGWHWICCGLNCSLLIINMLRPWCLPWPCWETGLWEKWWGPKWMAGSSPV